MLMYAKAHSIKKKEKKSMKSMSVEEMKLISAGGTYTLNCEQPGCNYSVSTTYVDPLLSYAVAKMLCEQRMKEHMMNVHILG